jgi:hypothetical protein
MAAVVEPRVTREKLDELLDLGAEHENLDYKETCDLDVKADLVEIAKDIGAMQFDGGFIVIGADSSGALTGRLTETEAEKFDEANLRNKIDKWIEPPLDLLVCVHNVEGNWAVLIYVGRSSAGACVFAADGQYEGQGGKIRVAFRQGDVYVRDGSRSTRWRQSDVAKFRARIREAEKEAWRSEFSSDIEGIIRASTAANAVAEGPASLLTWQLDDATFEDAVTEQLRRGDEIPLKLLLDRMPQDAERLIQEGNLADLGTLLDRLACLLTLMIRLDLTDWFHRIIETLVAIYNLTFDEHGVDRSNAQTAAIQLAVIERVMAVGAYAVRRSAWEYLSELVLQQPTSNYPEIYTNWIRHAGTMAARAHLLEEVDNQGRPTEIGLLSQVMARINRLGCVHPDLEADDDRLLSSVAQFDALAMLAVLTSAPGDRDYPYYPNFARYYWRRIEPILARVITDSDLRSALAIGTDEELARDLHDMLSMASSEARQFRGGDPLSDPTLVRFLEAFPRQQ